MLFILSIADLFKKYNRREKDEESGMDGRCGRREEGRVRERRYSGLAVSVTNCFFEAFPELIV